MTRDFSAIVVPRRLYASFNDIRFRLFISASSARHDALWRHAAVKVTDSRCRCKKASKSQDVDVVAYCRGTSFLYLLRFNALAASTARFAFAAQQFANFSPSCAAAAAATLMIMPMPLRAAER